MLGTPYHIQDIAQASLAKDLFQGRWEARPLKYVSFDTRNISHGVDTVFVALKTSNRDGYDFIEQAYARGVRNFITERKLPYPDVNYALVEDSLEALQTWAMFHRQQFSYPVIAITGSNGKTTVKEWLATLLEWQFQLVKSPMSYNSQLGVALSLLQMYPQADLAIIEAGISQVGEMEVLEQMIRPTHGVLTHMGPAHAEGFENFEQKLEEKLILFQEVEKLWMGADQENVFQAVQQRKWPLSTVGFNPQANIKLEKGVEGIIFQEELLNIPFQGAAQQENAVLATHVAHELGVSLADLKGRLPLLYPVQMRSEIISDNPDITILNDSYTTDPDSVRQAFRQLAQTDVHPQKSIILTDIPHLGEHQLDIQTTILKEAQELVGEHNVFSIGPIFHAIHPQQSFYDVAHFMERVDFSQFRKHTVLLKGARSFALEQLLPRFNHRLNSTYFQVNLSQLAHNYRFLKSQVPAGTKTMCMVKASSYGSGTWEIAQQLEKEGATYFAVAYVSEGVQLREGGIRLPIMVMNPDPSAIEALLRYDLEPEVSNLHFLKTYIRAARLSEMRTYRIHLKLETGMGRLGFRSEDIKDLLEVIGQHPDLEVISVLSHLSAADDPGADAFSEQQIQSFQHMYQQLHEQLGLVSFRHILNTAGILRFPHQAMEMVRMGIGLYGIDPVHGLETELKEIGSLHSQISQIQTHPEGVPIGYGRAQTTERPSRIATIPIGYADGIPRSVGEGKASFLIHGQLAPTFGRICMDMLMVDVTDIPEAQAGDEIVIFGKQEEYFLSIQTLAQAADTIPYELLVRISPRVGRVYVQD
ncbi:MAG: bifunctional UDP-N-acetylmuramoyl-tripeptide:D-alanyl-D-alanine ligase/alanine racemase [Bacteroidota bacterium]